MMVWITAVTGLLALSAFTLMTLRGGRRRMVEERRLSLASPLRGRESLGEHLTRLGLQLRVQGRGRLWLGNRRSRRLMKLLHLSLRPEADREPAVQWLRDNGRAVEEQLRIQQREEAALPPLPALHGGGLRLTALTEALALGWQGSLHLAELPALLSVWQESAGMTEEELTALPQALRHTLLRLLLCAAEDAAGALAGQRRGRRMAARLLRHQKAFPCDLSQAGLSPEGFQALLGALSGAGASALLQRVDQQAMQLGMDVQTLKERARARQMERGQWMGALIASLRALDKVIWPEFLESCDPLHRCLLEDPAGVYPAMDFESRRMYVQQTARLARQMRMPQARVALGALHLAQEAERDGIQDHVGYYLLETPGIRALYGSLRLRRGGMFPLRLFFHAHGAGLYRLLLGLGVVAGTGLMLLLRMPAPLWPLWALVFSQPWRTLIQRMLHRLYPPQMLPRLHLPRLTPQQRTLVVLPTLLTRPEEAIRMIGRLSELCHADPDPCIEYMLLGDFGDSLTAEEVADDLIIRAGASALAALQAEDPQHTYLYFQRRRVYDRGERAWIGRERKRGNLESLNRLIVDGSCDDLYDFVSLPPDQLHRRYAFVLTLDQDTELPPDETHTLVGALSHPLTARRRMADGWRGVSLLQPLMETDPAEVRTPLARLLGGAGGVDPYQTGSCPFYQRLCGRGSFQGKGIYDPEGLLEATRNWLLPDTVLSHDLLEGELAGCAAASTLRLYDGHPATWSGWLKRAHRWARGDWQLLPWLLPVVYTPQGLRRNPLDGFSRHKLWDNLRRSLLPLGQAGMLTYSMLAARPGLFALLVLLTLAPGLHPASWGGAWIRLCTLPSRLTLQLDAMGRALWRMLVSHEKRLNWVPSAQAELTPQSGLFTSPWPQWLGALLLLGACLLAQPLQLLPLPLGICFALFPLTLPRLEASRSKARGLTPEQRDALRNMAQSTWRFFDQAVTPATHALPPDNVQTEPFRGAALRTSPTNIGLYLLSALAMVELGELEADEAARRIRPTLDTLESLPTWRGHLYNWYDLTTLAPLEPLYVSAVDSGNYVACLMACAQLLRQRLSQLDAADRELPARLDALAQAVQLSALYDPAAQLFSIGIDPRQPELSSSHYDLLASEARLLSFVAVCTRQVPLRHFARLNRTRVRCGRSAPLMSWSGTLFEYLMPHLLLPLTPGTLLHQSCSDVLRLQQRAAHQGIWGVSESGYYAFDPQLNYQYRAFGLPALAADPHACGGVYAPYAAALGLELAPRAALEALERMRAVGMETPSGFYESLDTTPERTGGESFRIVRSHMAHHQGMLLCAITNALTNRALIRAFCRMPRVRAFLLLLRERADTRRPVALTLPKPEALPTGRVPEPPCVLSPLCLPVEGALLSGGSAFLLQSASGLSVMGCDGVWFSRFTRDPACREGLQFYLVEEGRMWQPFDPRFPGEVQAQQGRITITRTCRELRMTLTCFVDPVRQRICHQLELENLSAHSRTLEVADYMEVSLAPEMEQLSHPAYSNLFLESAPLGDRGILLHRRRRAPEEPSRYLCHLLALPGDQLIYPETDREAFLGRNGSPWRPEALRQSARRGFFGAPVHPCAALRCPLSLAGRGRVRLLFVTCCLTQEDPPRVEDFAMEPSQLTQSLQLAQLRQQVLLDSLGIPADELPLLHRLTGAVQWLHQPHQGAATPVPLPAEELWSMGLSGDLPLLAVFLRRGDSPLLRLALHFAAWQRASGLRVELALAVLDAPGSPAHAAVREALHLSPLRDLQGKGVALLDRSTLSSQRYALLHAAASLSLDDRLGSVQEQLDALTQELSPTALAPRTPRAPAQLPHEELPFDNGYGGFLSEEGGYVIRLPAGIQTPAPWCNYLCREDFGTLCCESGLLFSWGDNSHLHRLTPWVNDPVTPQGGEFLLIEDMETGRVFSPTRLPLGQAMDCRIIHQPGVTVYQAQGEGLTLQWTCFTDPETEAGCRQLRLRAQDHAPHRLRLHVCMRFVMGTDRRAEGLTCVTLLPQLALALHPAWPCLGFLASLSPEAELCRMSPAALQGVWGQVPWGLRSPRDRTSEDAEPPCVGASDRGNVVVMTQELMLAGESSAEMVYLTGLARQPEEIEMLLARYRREGVKAMERQVLARWSAELSALTCHLPAESLALMMNSCLPYQVRNARLWARAGLYQAGGAIGFRDQLQDMTALLYTHPQEVRRHLLLCASRQYEAGDVQHWWHPGQAGVRTRISDDRLFLPFLTAWYIQRTGDSQVLAASAPFLQNADIPEGRHDLYHMASPTPGSATLLEHCLRAIRCLRLGPRGIPLMEGGDWNDGMNRVEGESVFLGFFLCRTLHDFAPLCPPETAQELRQLRQAVMEALETHAWDGAWYLRAWYPDGRALGSHESPACQIDLLSQCWAVLAGASPERCVQALDSVMVRLHRPELGLTALLTPPFPEEVDTGYISGYAPGLRENGGQYTHTLPWLIWALAELGRTGEAWQLVGETLPIHHADTQQKAEVYRLEPYFTAGDLYTAPGWEGRGGWSAYTGSAAWLYTVVLEQLLGLRKQGNRVCLRPRLPADWDGFALTLHLGQTTWHLQCRRDAACVTVDGEPCAAGQVELVEDGRIHEATFPLRNLP